MNIEPNKAVLIWFQCWMKYCLMMTILTLSWRITSDIMLSLPLRVVPCCLHAANKVCNVWCISIWVMIYQCQQHSCLVILWNKPLSTNILYFLEYSFVLELNNTQFLEISLCCHLLPLLLHLFQVLTLVTRRHVNLCLVKKRINDYPSQTFPETLDFVSFQQCWAF
jgi:hypothetical protein